MQVIAFSSSRPGPEGELQHAEEIGTATLLLGMMGRLLVLGGKV